MTGTPSELSERFDFPEEELKVLELWRELDAFQTSLRLAKDRPVFSFFDGPPFATGLPHYGHLLAGTIKDTVTRYASLQGYYVERRFGWDCHGLPVEYEIDKQFGINSKADVMSMGIAKYNNECRNIVMRYSAEWEKTVERMARWIDFKNDFKTMYPSYMESVWWVFKTLYEKNLIYRGFRVMPYSTACSTPLSNFELALNYKDVQDPSVVVAFPLEGNLPEDHGASLIAWTTTPWTLPSNLMICAHPEFDYVYFRLLTSDQSLEKVYIALESRISDLFPGRQYEVVRRVKGKELEGKRYTPLFDFFLNRLETYPTTFTVITDTYVTADTGTGLVHQAPFGQEDFENFRRAKIISDDDIPCPIDDSGKFTNQVPCLVGQYWKDANTPITRMLEEKQRLVSKTQVVHSYPHCWRSDTPLIYKPVPCWFVRVTEKIPEILQAIEETSWVPEHVKEKRFHNWISTAVDWAVSRNRYWGTPIPIWANGDFSEIVCIGSVEELSKLSGVTGIVDLHRENVDHITIPSKKGDGSVLRRVEEVLDCWFESGAVPYGQAHYPFFNTENEKAKFEASFPADFIGEGLDQTRGWFYTLVVLGSHLFGQAPFRNVIVNGLVLASDGKKMSKRLKNYPEPSIILNSYGADALRLYLINSPVVRAENLRFKEEGVKAIVKDVLLPWYNAYRFLASQLELASLSSQDKLVFDPAKPPINDGNVMDKWILSAFETLLTTVKVEMTAYRLFTVLTPLLKFIEALTNWYIRFNRRRLKGEQGQEEMLTGLHVLFSVLYRFTVVMAPFTPFLSENIYQKLRPFAVPPSNVTDDRSVHFLLYPVPMVELVHPDIERAMGKLQDLVERVRTMRENKEIPLKTPLKEVLVVGADIQMRKDLESLESYVLEELNVRTLLFSDEEAANGVGYQAIPNFKLLGTRLKKDFGPVQAAIKSFNPSQLREYLKTNEISVLGHLLTGEDLEVIRVVDSSKATGRHFSCARDHVVFLDIAIDEELRTEGTARELANRVQRLRKKVGLKANDEIIVRMNIVQNDQEGLLANTLEGQVDFLTKLLKSQLVLSKDDNWSEGAIDSTMTVLGSEETEVVGGMVKVDLLKRND